MLTFIALGTFTDQGLRSVKGTVDRANVAREAAAKFGVKMKDIYWTQGQYDLVITCECNDEPSINAFNLMVASQGNVRFQTLRAITADEMKQVLSKLP